MAVPERLLFKGDEGDDVKWVQENKRCLNCSKELEVSEFSKDKSRKDGLCDWCKECTSARNKKYRQNNKEKVRNYHREWAKRKPHHAWAKNTIFQHKRSGFIVNIDTDWLTQLAKNTFDCILCDKTLLWSYGDKNGKTCHNSPTLDRINNEQHLDINNTQIICAQCNATKGTRTIDEFVEYCNNITKKFVNKNIINIKGDEK